MARPLLTHDRETREGSPLMLALGVFVSAEATAAAVLLLLRDDRVLAAAAAAVAAAVNVLVLPMAGGFRGHFAQHALDRMFETSILAVVAWNARASSPRLAVVALVALGLSYLATYERARGESLGYRGSESAVYRGVRSALVVGGLLTGWVEASLWALAGVTAAAAVIRVSNVVRQERRKRPSSWSNR